MKKNLSLLRATLNISIRLCLRLMISAVTYLQILKIPVIDEKIQYEYMPGLRINDVSPKLEDACHR